VQSGTPAIELEDVRVTYRSRRGSVTALDGLSLAVPEGGVCGLLGSNGSGKTTAIRAIVGLLRRAQGQVRVLGKNVPRHLPDVIDDVGALVEQPSFFPNFTGRRNLELLARARGISAQQVDATLEQVGLGPRADTRYATYSLGMKQRLGVAAALLKDPRLIVLDEPANGLDPSGILEVRTLLRELGAQGRTVFVSSHLLSEVEQTCDSVAIVAHGRCVASGMVHDLLSAGIARYRVRVEGDGTSAASLLTSGGWRVELDVDGAFVVDTGSRPSSDITRALAERNLFVSELTPVSRTLEDVFLELTRDPAADAVDAPDGA
jgi:ABC-2 type transport system ATP-binding protein